MTVLQFSQTEVSSILCPQSIWLVIPHGLAAAVPAELLSQATLAKESPPLNDYLGHRTRSTPPPTRSIMASCKFVISLGAWKTELTSKKADILTGKFSLFWGSLSSQASNLSCRISKKFKTKQTKKANPYIKYCNFFSPSPLRIQCFFYDDKFQTELMLLENLAQLTGAITGEGGKAHKRPDEEIWK